MNTVEIFDQLIQHAAVAKITLEDFEEDDYEEGETAKNELVVEHKMALLSIISFVGKHYEEMRNELLDGKEPPKVWTNIFIR